MTDPVSDLTHSHERLSSLALGLAPLVRAARSGGRIGAQEWDDFAERLTGLREELLHHFAKEEEGLFPFVRAHVPSKAETVRRMEDAHDTICGAVVRMAHLASRSPHELGAVLPSLLSLHERFEHAYAEHAREETELLEELGRALNERQRAELADLVQGL
jgi:iron-sulfur cluster repair protein YtfE (RIC family)